MGLAGFYFIFKETHREVRSFREHGKCYIRWSASEGRFQSGFLHFQPVYSRIRDQSSRKGHKHTSPWRSFSLWIPVPPFSRAYNERSHFLPVTDSPLGCSLSSSASWRTSVHKHLTILMVEHVLFLPCDKGWYKPRLLYQSVQ